MLTTATIIVRVAFILGLLVVFIGPMLFEVSAIWRKAGITTTIVAAVLLVVLRIALRVATPEELPSSSG